MVSALEEYLETGGLPEVVLADELLRQGPRGVFNGIAADQLVDPLHRNTEVRRKGHLGDAERGEELLAQNHAGMCRDAVLRNHGPTFYV
jgi:hypothetical protein